MSHTGKRMVTAGRWNGCEQASRQQRLSCFSSERSLWLTRSKACLQLALLLVVCAS
jgi:hypothetical protein